jgi:hypothetical protein
MKVYVDELPKSCEYCFCNNECYCELLNKSILKSVVKYDNCPLQALADYTNQVRKEIVQEIKDLAGDYFDYPYCENCGDMDGEHIILKEEDLTEILDQIQGE